MHQKFAFFKRLRLRSIYGIKYTAAVALSLLLAAETTLAATAVAVGGRSEESIELAQDSSTPEVDDLLIEGVRLFQEGSAESLQQAIQVLQQAQQLYQAAGTQSGEAACFVGIGSVYNALGERQQALEYYNQALPLIRAVEDRAGEARVLYGIGSVYDALGERQQALEYYNQALPLIRAVEERDLEATTLNNIGLVYNALGERQQALEYYHQALPLSQAVEDRAGEAATLNNIGSVYNDLGERQQALEYYNQALPLSRAVEERAGEVVTLGNVTSLYRDQGDLADALKQLESAITIIEDLRADFTNQELQTAYFATVQDYYQLKIDLLMQLGQEAAAFETSEAARARTLLELLSEANVDIRQGVDPQLLAQEQALRQALQDIEGRRTATLSGDHTPAEAAALDQESDAVLQQLEQKLAEIRQVSPAYADLKKPQPLTLTEIRQQVLDPDTVLLQYALGDEQSYLWVVGAGADQFQTYPLPGREQIDSAVDRFISSVAIPGAFAFSDVKRTGDALRQVALPELPAWAAGKRLLVVGDGPLQEVPFAALPVLDAADYTPLLTEHEILSQPSASSIAILRQSQGNRAAAPQTLAVLADPVYRADDVRVAGQPEEIDPLTATSTAYDPRARALTRNLRDLDLRNIERLPFTRTEADKILALVPDSESIAVSDFAANADWVKSPALDQYRFVHLATHGFLNSTNPSLSGVVLALVDDQGQTRNDGFLRLHDIFNLRLNADLVVLSACLTGLGNPVGGEGLVGISRGFMYAGAERLAVSLWFISDEGTANVMEQFYRAMLQGDELSPAEALRATQSAMWEAGESPYYWAAFTIQGEWR